MTKKRNPDHAKNEECQKITSISINKIDNWKARKTHLVGECDIRLLALAYNDLY